MNIGVYVKHEGNGWDVSVIRDGECIKSAWADCGTSAAGKAAILADHYSDDNGQRASIKWLHVLNADGEIVANPEEGGD